MSDDSESEFEKAMRGVRKLTHTKITPPRSKPPVKSYHKKTEPLPELSEVESLAPVSGSDLIQFSRPGIQHKILRNLRSGQYNAQAILDLHGMGVLQAKQSLLDFLHACQKKEVRYALIIHGKGRKGEKPILKNKLNHWLRELDHVLAFCSANKQGRGGALYLLLKRTE